MFKPINNFVLVEPICQAPPEEVSEEHALGAFFPAQTVPTPNKHTVCKVLAISPGQFLEHYNSSHPQTSSTMNMSSTTQLIEEGTLVVVESHMLDVITLLEDEFTIAPASAFVGYFEKDEN